MSNTPDVSTDWGMWSDLESTLDKKRINRLLPIFLGLPIFLILGGIIGYMIAPKQKVFSNAVEIKKDTIYLTEKIHTIDTLIKTEYITKWKYKNPIHNKALQIQAQQLASLNSSLQESIRELDGKLNDYRYAFSESILKNDPKYRSLDFFNSKSSIIPSNKNITSDIERFSIDKLAFSPQLDLKVLKFDRPDIMLIHNLLFENLVNNQKAKSLLDHIIPDYINLGASIETPGLALTNNLSAGLEFGVGLNAEIIFSPNFSLVTGIRSRSSENKTTDPIIAANYPQPIIGDKEIFKNLSVKSSFIDIPITLKYNILKFNQNDVYLTGGLLLSKHSQTEYKYEYVRNTTEIYFEEKAEVSGWSLGSYIFGVGYEMDAWSNTLVFAESFVRYNYKSDFEPVHGVGFRFGMYYKI